MKGFATRTSVRHALVSILVSDSSRGSRSSMIARAGNSVFRRAGPWPSRYWQCTIALAEEAARVISISDFSRGDTSHHVAS